MNRFGWQISVLLYFLVFITGSHGAIYSTLVSPNGHYTLSLKVDTEDRLNGEYWLVDLYKVLWAEKCRLRGSDSEFRACWTIDSYHVLIIYPYESLRILAVGNDTASASSVDETPLSKSAEKLIPYDWGSRAQGGIPHFAVLELKAFANSSIDGIYERGKYPRKIYIPFNITFQHLPTQEYTLTFGEPILKNWGDGVPSIKELETVGCFRKLHESLDK